MSNPLTGTFSADGNSSSITLQNGGVLFLGSSAASDFGSGTVTVQILGPDGLWYNSADTYTARDVDNIAFQAPSVVRLNLSSSTSPDLAYAIVPQE